MSRTEKIPPKERCIVALDVPTRKKALDLVEKLDNHAKFYKIGLELFAGGEGRSLLKQLVDKDLKVFVDLKLYDVPATVARATQQIAKSGAQFLTVHGDSAIMQAAVKNKGDKLKILAVTALTSLDQRDLKQLGYRGTIRKFVLERAKQAQEAGCDGVICSGQEIVYLRKSLDKKFILVTPGVRQTSNITDDQKRTATPASIIASGGDYLVVGRPIRDAEEPCTAWKQITKEIKIAQTFAKTYIETQARAGADSKEITKNTQVHANASSKQIVKYFQAYTEATQTHTDSKQIVKAVQACIETRKHVNSKQIIEYIQKTIATQPNEFKQIKAA